MQAPQRTRTAALPDPGVRRGLGNHLEEGIAYLRKQMHVLMTIDEVGRPAENRQKGFKLGGDLDHQSLRLQAARRRRAQHVIERRKAAVARWRETLAHRFE